MLVEFKHEGKVFNVELPDSILIKKQRKIIKSSFIDNEMVDLEVSYDDNCGNKHNTFSLTHNAYVAHLVNKEENIYRKGSHLSCGVASKELLEKFFPEYAHLEKFHGCTSHGPLYYLGNTLYHVGDKDCWGMKKGEEKILSYGYCLLVNDIKYPILHFRRRNKLLEYLMKVEGFLKENESISDLKEEFYKKEKGFQDLNVYSYPYKDPSKKFTPQFSIVPNSNWSDCFYDFFDRAHVKMFIETYKNNSITFKRYPDSIRIGEGKERDLEAARSTAIWPEANVEDFTAEKLIERLPPLMIEFKNEMEKLGFVY